MHITPKLIKIIFEYFYCEGIDNIFRNIILCPCIMVVEGVWLDVAESIIWYRLQNLLVVEDVALSQGWKELDNSLPS